MMADLDAVWQEMDRDRTLSTAGQLRRRISAHSSFDLYLTQTIPAREVGFRAEFDGPPGTAWRDVQGSKGFAVAVQFSEPERASIQITERDPRFHAVFAALVTDVVNGLMLVESLPRLDRPNPLDFVANRLQRWQTCLRTMPDGLSEEAQAGLYGELTVLRNIIVAGMPPAYAVSGWSGSSKAMQDFQYGGSSVEVKASRQTLPTAVRISSERQLDTVAVNELYWVHVSLEPRTDGGGESLAQIVESVRTSVGRNTDVGLNLDDRLLEYGHLDVPTHRYEATSYAVRAIDYFCVEDGFPRIVESDLVPGVGDVSYLLALAACEDFRVDVQRVYEGIGLSAS